MAGLSLNRVYVATTEGIHTFALNPADGANFDPLPTTVPANAYLQAGLAIAQSGTIYVSMPDGFLHAYNQR